MFENLVIESKSVEFVPLYSKIAIFIDGFKVAIQYKSTRLKHSLPTSFEIVIFVNVVIDDGTNVKPLSGGLQSPVTVSNLIPVIH
jgi:hypothetical protein